MLGRPLEYASLKTVLLHLDANVRIEISRRMPSIREIEKIVPLKIWNLSFKGFSTSVNNTTYRLGIYQNYTSGKASLPVLRENRDGGAQKDFDEFGFPVPSGHSDLLPGDVSFQREGDVPFRYNTKRAENYYRQSLRRYQLAKKKYDEITTNGSNIFMPTLAFQNRLNRAFANDKATRVEEIKNLIRWALRHPNGLDQKIEDFETKLIPFECRRNQSKPPFTCYIQLTIQKENSKIIQRFEYNKKLFEAAKQLNQVLFGCRTFPIHVSNFHFGLRRNEIERCIYRLPIGFYLHATEVDCDYRMLNHKNFKAIVENSENLNTLRIDGYFHRGFDFHNPTILNSKKLVITSLNILMIPEYNQIARDTLSLDFQFKNELYSSEEYFGLYQSWLSGNRPIGATFCVELMKRSGEKVLELIRDQSVKTEETERCLTVFINTSTKVEVFYEPFNTAEECYDDFMSKWILKIRIVKA